LKRAASRPAPETDLGASDKPVPRRAAGAAKRVPAAGARAGRAPPAAAGAAVRGRRGRGGAGAWHDVVASQHEQFQLKRNALLREAARAFNARGFHNTSLDDVAAALGVTKAALYYYVRSKQEILFECHMMAYELGDQALAFARANGRDGLERADMALRRFVELYTGEMGRFAMLSDHEALDAAQRAAVLARRDAFDRALRGFVEEGIADGSVRPIDARLAVLVFMGAVNWMATHWFRPDGPLSAAEIAAGFEDLFVAAIGSGKGRRKRSSRRRAAP
jgi:AcrR family transcriptional regulator